MGFCENFSKPPTSSPVKHRKVLDIEGDQASRRLSAASTASPTARTEDFSLIDGGINHSDLREKLSLISLENLHVVRPNSPRRHQSNRECKSPKQQILHDESLKLNSPQKRAMKRIQKAVSTRNFGRSKSSVEESSLSLNPSVPTSPRRSMKTNCKVLDSEGDKAQRRVSTASTTSSTARNKGFSSIEGGDNHSDLKAKLLLVSLENLHVVRPNSPRRHQSNRECKSPKQQILHDEPQKLNSPLRAMKSLQKAMSAKHFGRSRSAVEEASVSRNPCVPTSPRRSMKIKDLSNRLLGLGKSSVEEKSTAQLSEAKPDRNIQQSSLETPKTVLSQQASIAPSSPVRAHARKLVFSSTDGLDGRTVASTNQYAPPSSPLRTIARKISWSNMEELWAPSAAPMEEYSSPPSSPLRAIARTLSWSNMDASVAPRFSSLDEDGEETVMVARKSVRAHLSPNRSPPKTMVKKLSHRKMTGLQTPSLGDDELNNESPTPRHVMNKKLSVRSIGNVSAVSTLTEQPKERSKSPMRTLVKKLSLGSLCSASKVSDYDELTPASESVPRRITLSKHFSLSRIDHSRGLSDAPSMADQSAFSTRSRSSLTSTLRKSTSLRILLSSCTSETAAVDTSTPEAAARVISASPPGRSNRSLSPKRTMQKQQSDRHVRSVSPRRTPHGSCPTSSAYPSSSRNSSLHSPVKTSRRSKLQKQTSERTPTKSLHKLSAFDAPLSPVKTSCATARKLEPIHILTTPPSSPRRRTIAGSPRRAIAISSPTQHFNRVQSCRVLSTPVTERKTFASIDECIGEYDKIVNIEETMPRVRT
jgi:hypothetical protein